MKMELNVTVEKDSRYMNTYHVSVSVDDILLAKDVFLSGDGGDDDIDIDLTLPENKHHLAATVRKLLRVNNIHYIKDIDHLAESINGYYEQVNENEWHIKDDTGYCAIFKRVGKSDIIRQLTEEIP